MHPNTERKPLKKVKKRGGQGILHNHPKSTASDELGYPTVCLAPDTWYTQLISCMFNKIGKVSFDW